MFNFSQYKPKVLVIGDLMLDLYLWGAANRISPEAPVQIIDIKNETLVLGGAGNVINNLASLGASVAIASVIGSDAAGLELSGFLQHPVHSDRLVPLE